MDLNVSGYNEELLNLRSQKSYIYIYVCVCVFVFGKPEYGKCSAAA